MQDKEATVTVLAVMAVSVVTATPLKLNPPFPYCKRFKGQHDWGQQEEMAL